MAQLATEQETFLQTPIEKDNLRNPAKLEEWKLKENPGLSLSGNIISVTFCLPYCLKYTKESEWELSHRRGKSTLTDSFAYLSSNETPWNHTLVGWTGEITVPEDSTLPITPIEITTSRRYSPLNKSSAPIPVDASTNPTEHTHSEGLWITKESQDQLSQRLSQENSCRTVPIWLDDRAISTTDEIYLKDQARWRRYAEHNLYPLFHYKQNMAANGKADRLLWTDYCYVNQRFAQRILELYKPGDILIIHDYHLFLLPRILRDLVPQMYISFTLHIPFPSSEFLRCLSRRKEILNGALGADLIGFQTPSYSRHFASCCSRILGLSSDMTGVEANGRKVTIGNFPIGIDAAVFEKAAFEDPLVDEKLEELFSLYNGKKLIVGRDRLDTMRGVSQKLIAFERFLEDYPQWRGKVVLIQVTSPTSIEEDTEDDDNKIANKVSELVATINGVYGSLSFSPVLHYPQYLSHPEYLALLRAADIGLITSVRDAINATSLEYVICQRDNHGPLIISEFSGTAGILKDAIHINPWDITDVSKQINIALTLSADKKAVMHKSLYHSVTTHNVRAWSDNFIHHLLIVLNSTRSSVSTPTLDKTILQRQYNASSKRLFMFDYDGTLTPIVRDPAAALPSKYVIRALEKLAANQKNSVWIISGRDQTFLQKHLGHIQELGLSAEHGSFIRYPGISNWEDVASLFDLEWQNEVLKIFQRYTHKTPGAFIERKRCALTWHYRPSDPTLGAYHAQECNKEIENNVINRWEVEVMTGKANLEVRPSFINKGEIVRRLLSESDPKPDFVLCIGDDFTDEDMFSALKGANVVNRNYFTVTVGASSKKTMADWCLPEPKDVVSYITDLYGNEIQGDKNHENPL